MPGTFVSRHSPISETCTLSLYLHILTFPGLSHSYLQLCHTKSSLLLLPPYHHCWLFHTPCTSSLLLMRTQSSLCILTSLTPSFLSQPLSRTAYSSWTFHSASYHTLHPLSSYFFTSSFNQSSSSSFYFPQPHYFTLFSHTFSSFVLPHLICPPCTSFSPIPTYLVLHLLCCHCCHFQAH